MPYQILLVDDDAYFRSEFKELMYEFDIQEAGQGDEALKILKKPHNIDLVILDERLPGARGTELLEQVHDVCPDMRSIILTGHSSKEVAIDAVRGKAADFFEKPLTQDKIEKIRELILSCVRGEKDRSQGGIQGKIQQAQYFIERNYDKKLTLKDIADEVCLSPKYLSRVFKKNTGMSFLDYKLKLRIQKAKEMLTQSGENIEEISYKLGYQNPESFGKVFRQYVNLTPREYRDQQKQTRERSSKSSPSRKQSTPKKTVELTDKVLSQSHDAIIEYDLKGKVLMWSPSAVKLYGWKRDEMLHKERDDTISFKKMRQLFKTSSRNGKDHDYETQRKTKGGRTLDVWGKMFADKDSRGQVMRFITIERDITDRKKHEQAIAKKFKTVRKRSIENLNHLEEKKSELRQTQQVLNKEKHFAELGRMASVVAHEMRRPINSIQLASWNIKNKVKDPSITGNLGCIENMVQEAEQIISNLLNYARIKEPQHEKISVYKLLNQCLATTRANFSHPRVKLDVDIQSLRRKKLRVDPLQFKQVISNLLKNADEALAEKKTNARITVTGMIRDQQLVIRIRDNGKGIPKEDRDKIFEPFVSHKQKGTGLGLAICKQIMDLHQGTLSLQSQVKKGTTFTLTFPL
jgi:PAS domain S-box-containing protein